MKNVVFASGEIHFIQPSYVEGDPPKIMFTNNNRKQNCKMAFKKL